MKNLKYFSHYASEITTGLTSVSFACNAVVAPKILSCEIISGSSLTPGNNFFKGAV